MTTTPPVPPAPNSVLTPSPPKLIVLPEPASPAATIGGPLATDAIASPAFAAGASLGTSMFELIEYQPPALPAQAALDVGGIGAFRVARAAGTLPGVPITYDVRRRTWLLLEDYSYVYQGHALTAKAGYAFDLSTIPRALWWLIAPNELSIVAPLFHDLLYEYRGRLPSDTYVSPYRTYTRLEADDLFLHLLELEGVPWWRRVAAYSAIRAVGGVYWQT